MEVGNARVMSVKLIVPPFTIPAVSTPDNEEENENVCFSFGSGDWTAVPVRVSLAFVEGVPVIKSVFSSLLLKCVIP
jgi:hypothetical protein